MACTLLGLLAVCVLAAAPATAQPTVTDLQPESGTDGSALRIYGSGFSTSDNEVTIGGLTAPIGLETSTVLSVSIPSGVSGPAEVRVSSNGSPFVSAPKRLSAVTYGTGGLAPDTSLRGVQGGEIDHGDVDGDGDFDLIVTGRNDAGAAFTQLYLNDGDGTFTAASTPNLPNVRNGTVDLADLDNDGDLDVLITGVNESGTTTTAVYTKDDNTLSYTKQEGSLPDVKNGGVDLGDLDGDGDLDLVLTGTDGGGNPTTVFLSNRREEDGGLDFNDVTSSVTSSLPVGLENGTVDIADLDDDQALDVLVTGTDGSSRYSTIYFNDGSGENFTTSSPSPNVSESATAIGDINNDGFLDLVLSGKASSDTRITATRTTAVLLNDGNGSFSTAASLRGVNVGTLTLADLDSDGLLDLLLTGGTDGDRTNPQGIVYRGTGDASTPFEPVVGGLNTFRESAATVADFDGDGGLDPVVAGNSDGPTTTVYQPGLLLTKDIRALLFNAADVSPIQDLTLPFNAPVADLTGLADSIVVYGRQRGRIAETDGTVGGGGTNTLTYEPNGDLTPGDEVSVRLRNGLEGTQGAPLSGPTRFRFRVAPTSGPAAFPVSRTVSDSETGVREVATGFLTGDGNLDLVVASTGDAEVTLYPGNGDGTFGTPKVLDTSIQARALVLTDLTGDGLPDVVVGSGESEGGNSGNDVIRYYANQGDGTFGPSTDITSGNNADDVRDLAAADIGNDGDRDLVAVTQDNSSVLLYRNDGNEQFTEVNVDNGDIGDPRAVALTDADRNGTIDVVAGSASDDNIVWYPNQGDGTFGVPKTLGAAVNPRSLHATNLDNDPFSEVVSAERGVDGTADDGAVAVYNPTLYNGSVTWTKAELATPDSVLTATPIDVNGDGQIDIVAGSVDGDALVWYKNTTDRGSVNPSFAQGQVIDPNRPNVQDVITGDFDGDGSLDPAVAAFGENTVATYPNVRPLRVDGTRPSPNATGVDTARSPIEITFNKSLDGSTVDPGSITLFGHQTGRLSPASVGASGNTLTLDPSGSFQPGETVTVSVLADSVADTDGVPLDSTYTFSFTTAPASGTGSFASVPESTTLTDVTLSAAEWGDVDGDGDLDVIVTGEDGGGSASAVVYENTSSGLTTLATLPGVGQSTGTSADWGDYDDDGDLDLIITGTTSSGTPSATIYRNDSGSFIDIGAGLTGVSDGAADWGDYDGDGDLDLVVIGADGATDTATIYENNGDTDSDGVTEFTSIGAGLTGASDGGVDWGDYDNDGVLDLVVTGTDGGTVANAAVYHHDGAGTFTILNKNSNGNTAGLIPDGDTSVGAEGGDTEWGDYDGDGDLDLIITGRAGSGTRHAAIFENDVANNNGFADIGAGLTGVQASSVDWGDYDGDSDLDLLITGADNTGTATTTVYENQAGSFSALGAGLEDVEIGDADWGDYNGDGRLDLVVTGRNSSSNATTRIYTQSRPLQVASTTPSRNAVDVSRSLSSIDVTFNKDLDAGAITASDVRVVGSQTGPISPFENIISVSSNTLTYEPARDFEPGETVTVSLLTDNILATDGTTLGRTYTFQFTAAPASTTPSFPVDRVLSDTVSFTRDATTADLSNDGVPDVLVAADGDGKVGWFENTGSGSFSGLKDLDTGIFSPYDVATADLDGDGDLDAIAAGASSNELRWYENDGTSTPFSSGTASVISTSNSPHAVAAGDLDGDGDPDLVAAAAGGDKIVWHENRIDEGDGFTTTASYIADAAHADEVVVADVDSNGTMDVLSSASGDNTVSWHKNTTGDGTSWSTTPITTTADGDDIDIAAADVDGDGDLDAVSSSSGDGTVAWYENTAGDGSNWSRTDVQTGVTGLSDVHTANLDGDGDLDLLYSADVGDRVAWIENTGSGSFASSDSLVTDDTVQPYSVASGDLDGDGTLDVVTAGDNAVTTHPNTTIAPQAITEAASATTGDGFTAEGAVNPGGLSTNVTFQYSRNGSFGSDSSVAATGSPITGDDTTGVSASVGSLSPATTYEYRVVATNNKGTTTGPARSVTTDTIAPQVAIAPASSIDTTQATVNGTVNPGGDTTAVAAQFGRTGSGALTELVVDTIRTSLTTDASVSDVSPDTLRPSTEYRYRLATRNGVGTDTSTFSSFSTNNVAPTAANDTTVTDEDTDLVVDVLANDTDVGEAALGGALDSTSVTVVDTAEIGTITAVDATTGALTYSPAPDSNGTDSLRYAVADDSSAVDTATVAITVNPVNDAPVASDDNATTDEDTGVTIDVLANDTDEEDALDPSSVTVTSAPAFGTTSVDASTGTITYTPAADSNGTDSFDYEVADTSGAVAGATVNVTVNAVNDAPTITTNAGRTVAEGADSLITDSHLAATDVESDPADLTYTVTTAPVNGQLYDTDAGSTVGSGGTFTQAALNNSRIEYRHDGSETTADSATVVAADPAGAETDTTVFSITITPSNDAPTITALSDTTINEDTATEARAVTIGDEEWAPSDLTLSATSNNADLVPNDSLTLGGSGADRTIRATPVVDSSGTATITVAVSDGSTQATTSFVLTVSPVNDAPVLATNAGTTVDEGTSTTIGTAVLAATDVENGPSALTYSVETVPANGTLASGGTALSTGDTFTQADVDGGALTYTHDGSETTSDSFEFTVTDGGGKTAGPETFSITVNPTNDPPTASNDNATTDEDQAVTVDVLANDSDPEGAIDTASVTVTSAPAFGTTSVDASTGAITYTPDADSNGTDSFDYEVADTSGAVASATVDVTVNPVNDAPVIATNAGRTVAEGADSLLTDAHLAATDVDAGDGPSDLTYTVTTAPVNGQFYDTGAGQAVGSGGTFTQADLNNSRIEYRHDGSETTADSATVVAADPAGATTDTTVFSITINPTNDAPTITALSDTTINEDTATEARAFTIGDEETATSDLTLSTSSDNADLVPTDSLTLGGSGADRTIRATPVADSSGTATITITASDGSKQATESFVLTVSPVNDAPVAQNDTAGPAVSGRTLSIAVLNNDSDPADDGPAGTLDPTSIQIEQAPSHGTATPMSDGTIQYEPTASYSGSDRFTYTVADAGASPKRSAPATVDLQVLDVSLSATDATKGRDVTITLSVGGTSQMTRDTLYAREGGTTAYTAIPFTGSDPQSKSAVIDASLVTARGVDYYLALETDGGTRLTVPAGGRDVAAARPRHLPVSFDQLTAPLTFEPEQYRMVSVPANPTGGIKAALRSAYGTYDASEWRVEQWRPAEGSDRGAYRSYPDIDSLRPGDAFWLITQRGQSLQLGTGQTVPADSVRTIPIETGWTQIGTPFGFSVPWDTIRTASGIPASQIDGPFAYRDTFRRADTLAPWTGYFVFSTEADTLRVPPTSQTASNKHAAPEPALSTQTSPKSTTDDRYTLRVDAHAGTETDRVRLGLRPGAKAGRDRFDVARPPSVERRVRLSVLETVNGRSVPHAASAKPLRRSADDGQSWTLRLQRPDDAPSSEVKLAMRGSGALPNGYRRYVLDLSRDRRIAPGALLDLDDDETRRLKIIVGTESYARKNSDGIALSSLQTNVRGTYPNPFTEQTTVEYVLADPQDVTIEIYDVLGRRLRTLVDRRQEAGVHRQTWDGTNRYGTSVGSGVYFLRFRAGDTSTTEKMVLVR